MSALRRLGLALLLLIGVDVKALDLKRMIYVIEQMEGGTWEKTPGGAGYMLPRVWYSYTTVSFAYSKHRQHALPIYEMHLEWLVDQFHADGLRPTAGQLYVAWRYGYEGQKALRPFQVRMAKDLEARSQNLYLSPAAQSH